MLDTSVLISLDYVLTIINFTNIEVIMIMTTFISIFISIIRKIGVVYSVNPSMFPQQILLLIQLLVGVKIPTHIL